MCEYLTAYGFTVANAPDLDSKKELAQGQWDIVLAGSSGLDARTTCGILRPPTHGTGRSRRAFILLNAAHEAWNS